jgi:hypothetical protein
MGFSLKWRIPGRFIPRLKAEGHIQLTEAANKRKPFVYVIIRHWIQVGEILLPRPEIDLENGPSSPATSSPPSRVTGKGCRRSAMLLHLKLILPEVYLGAETSPRIQRTRQ